MIDYEQGYTKVKVVSDLQVVFMTVTDAAHKYRETEDAQERIEEKLLQIDDIETDLYERHKLISNELKSLQKEKLDVFKDELKIKRKGSLQYRLSEIDQQLQQQNQNAEMLNAARKSLEKVQDDLERVFGKRLLYAEYDRIYHGKQ